MITSNQTLDHFVNCARKARNPAASNGEKRCRRMAQVILDNCGGVDDEAIEGMIEFIQIARSKPEACRKVLALD